MPAVSELISEQASEELEALVLNCLPKMQQAIAALLSPYGLQVESVQSDTPIPGSFFGEREAGLIDRTLYLREDTPVHSALHEAGHFICMSPERRAKLDTDAEGDYDEENGVCYLQILLADHLADIDRERMMLDMDRWGYSFRLGSAKVWFEQDAEDAKHWLIEHGIITSDCVVTFRLRDAE